MFASRSPWMAAALLFVSASLISGCVSHEILSLNQPATLPVDPPATYCDPLANDRVTLGLKPATVRHLDLQPRYMSLPQAIALALEQGYTGSLSPHSPGNADDGLVSFNGFEAFTSDSIRVLALQPAIAGTNVDESLARFDPQAFTNATWKAYDEPTQGLNSFTNGQAANLAFGLVKPLSTGGYAGVTWNTDYTFLKDTGLVPVNPSYFTRLQFGFEQPLLKGGGVLANQLSPDFPGSTLFQNLSGRFGFNQGILIARIRSEQQRAEFDRRISHMLLNVEAAYWNLYAAYVDLYTTDQALRMATEVYRVAKEQFPEKIDEGDFAGTRAQLQFYRGNRLQNIGRILEAERNLRLLLGLEADDGHRLVPTDAPTATAFEPDWAQSIQDALLKRPELLLVRQEIKRRQYQVDYRMNQLLPDLRFVAEYDLVGLGSRLDSDGTFIDANGIPQTNNALKSLMGTHYNDWTVGVRMSMPLGYRAEFAAIRQAKLEVAQANWLLKEQETKARSFLAKQYSKLFELADVIEARRQERLALAEQIDVRFRKFAAGKTPVDFLQDSVRQWATALSNEYRAVADYNTAIATFHFAKGTLMAYDNVNVLDGSIPVLSAVRAADHEQIRTEEIARRQTDRIVPPIQEQRLLPNFATREPDPVPTLFTPETPLPPPPMQAEIPQPMPAGPAAVPGLRLTNVETPFDPSQR